MTVPWTGVQDVNTEHIKVPVTGFMTVSLCSIVEQKSAFSPEYNNLHSKTVSDTASSLLGLILLRKKNDISRAEKKVVPQGKFVRQTFSLIYFEITVNKIGELIVLIGTFLIHCFICKTDVRSKRQQNKIKTCGKHRKSLQKASCFGLTYLDHLKKCVRYV